MLIPKSPLIPVLIGKSGVKEFSSICSITRDHRSLLVRSLAVGFCDSFEVDIILSRVFCAEVYKHTHKSVVADCESKKPLSSA